MLINVTNTAHLNSDFFLLCLWFYCLKPIENTNSALSHSFASIPVSLKGSIYSFVLCNLTFLDPHQDALYARTWIFLLTYSNTRNKPLSWRHHFAFFCLSYFCLPVEIYTSFIFLSPWFYCWPIHSTPPPYDASLFSQHDIQNMTDVVNLPNLIWEKKLGRLS